MASKSALLRNIRPSGGLFTENILLRLRDNPNQLKIGKIDSFLEEDTKEERKKLTDKKQIIFDWCVQKWDEISPNIEKWSMEDLEKKWLIPLFTLFDHEIEDFELNKENLEEDSVLKEFRISYQSRDHRDPFFQYVSVNEDFDSKIDRNPQKKSHHNVCQQFINFNPEIKWLFLSNGRILRILTKYYHSYSKGYLEFDLENIFANRDEREFNTLYSIIHSSRFNSKVKEGTLLIDRFQKDSVTEGVKIGDNLRDNVEHALELLGNELIQQNLDKIDVNEFYAELLRIIYRIIFILYAEQRDMLPGAGSLYFEQFSLSSLRIRAEKPIKAEKNYDLWNKMLITFNLIRDGNSLLGVNSYNGSLFKEDNLRIILKNGMKISNDIVLKVIRLLTTSANHKVRQRINFLEVSEEEIGAIYESLLDFKPYISSTSQFQLIEGTERKSTGSYYTPKALIDILIRTTLQPLVDDRLIKAGDDGYAREKAILDLKVCDPACGGGTFLLSALDYLGKKLAEIRTSSDSPLEDDLREARREILQHCIYGVDMNPLAVELAKISLWLRACVKDKPLNFLDNHIKCGNSLVGLGQKMEIKEINPNAFKAISGNLSTGIPKENIKLQNQARNNIKKEIKERKKEGKTTMITSFFTDKRTANVCSIKFQEIINMPENNPEKIIEKEKKYYELRKNENYQQALDEANIWTSTFFWPFEGNALGEIPRYTTIEQLRNNILDPELNRLMEIINKLVENYQFFHWFIEFPEVFSTGRKGFDCILTNPPWAKLLLKEKEFFVGSNNEIADTTNQSSRRSLIKKLKETDLVLYKKYENAWHKFKKSNNYYQNSDHFKLTAKGTLNTYPLFTERCWQLLSPNGYLGTIIPTGIILNFYMKDFFKELVNKQAIISMFDFINKNKLFNIGLNNKFCLLTLSGSNISQKFIPMTFNVIDPIEIQEPLSLILNGKDNFKDIIKKIPNTSRLILLEQKDFKLFNANTVTCPLFNNFYDYKLTKKIYQQNKIIYNKNNPIIPSLTFHRMFHMSDDFDKFHKFNDVKNSIKEYKSQMIVKEGIQYIPLYESKLIWQYDHRYASYEGCSDDDIAKGKTKRFNDKKKSLDRCIIPRFWIKEKDFKKKVLNWNYHNHWFLAIRKTARSTDKRTAIATIMPYYASVGSIKMMINITPKEAIYLLSVINSYVFDYFARQKVDLAVSEYILEQLPIPDFKLWQNYENIIIPICLELIYTNYELSKFAIDLGYNISPFAYNNNKRIELISKLNAIIALLYGVSKTDLNYILAKFPKVKEKEISDLGYYQTKELILKDYDFYKNNIRKN